MSVLLQRLHEIETQKETSPDPGDDPWMTCMRRGDFARAWTISDTVLRERAGQPCSDWPRHQQYIWNGRPIEGQRVLIRCYHGLGDTVQFIRYAPLVREMAREVIVWAQPALIPLLRTLHGIDRLLPLHDGTPEIEYDVDVEVMELPHIFRSTLETLPREIPYLHVKPAQLPCDDDGKFNVGLIWQAGDWAPQRNIAPALLAPLACIPGVRIYLLQRGSASRDWEFGPAVDMGRDDVLETAAIMRALDLVITIDTFPAHLAGALGVPVWTLLHANADWRWMMRRQDSPWYPTMRLFRQHRPDNWTEVIADIGSELRTLVRHTARGRNYRP